MDQFMDILTSNKRETGDLWTSFCNSNKNKTSVTMISRNGISTSKSNNSKILTNPGSQNDLFHISDNEVHDFIKEATDEMFRSNDDNVMRSNDLSEECKKAFTRSSQKVLTLNLSPEKKREAVSTFEVVPEQPELYEVSFLSFI